MCKWICKLFCKKNKNKKLKSEKVNPIDQTLDKKNNSKKSIDESETPPKFIDNNYNKEQIPSYYGERPQIQSVRQSTGNQIINESNDNQRTSRKQRLWDRKSITPSNISDSSVTQVYDLPQNGFRTVSDVLKSRNYEINEKIGNGAFGVVYKAFKINPINSSRQVMACKQISFENSNKDKFMDLLKREIFVLEKIKHKHIIELYDHFIIDNKVYIFMEFAECKSLNYEISYGPLKNEVAKRYFAQIITGIIHLHKQYVAHRDLKLDNILLVNSKEKIGFKDVKITDFGLSQMAFNPKKGIIKSGRFGGTRYYMAPEIIRLDVYRPHRNDKALEYDPYKADIWALGICLYEMLTKILPFDISNTTQMLANQENHNWEYPKHLKNTIHPRADHLLKQLLEPDVNLRIDPLGIVLHDWVKDQIDLTLIN